jgi:hypothetical protein
MPYSDPRKRVAASLAWNNRHPERMRAACTRAYVSARQEVIAAFGGKCETCASTLRLQLHHKNGDGREHRKSLKTPNLYQYLKRTGFPKAGLVLLCSVCHGNEHGKKSTGGGNKYG